MAWPAPEGGALVEGRAEDRLSSEHRVAPRPAHCWERATPGGGGGHVQAGLRALTGLVGTSPAGLLHWWPGGGRPFLQLVTARGGHGARNLRGPGAHPQRGLWPLPHRHSLLGGRDGGRGPRKTAVRRQAAPGQVTRPALTLLTRWAPTPVVPSPGHFSYTQSVWLGSACLGWVFVLFFRFFCGRERRA